jgi:outer membrane murein-binding lipoprotein Lpp
MTSATSTGHASPWLRAFATVILTLASVLSISNSAVLFRYLSEGKVDANDHRIQQLSSKFDHLSQQIDALQHQPASVSVGDFTAARQALDTRLSKLEQDRSTSELAQRIDALQARVDRLQTRQGPPASPTPRANRHTDVKPADASASAVPPTLPFRVLGLEIRGGERFVSILADNVSALGEVRLLRPGDSQATWRLESIENDAAIFRNFQPASIPTGAADQTRRLVLPQESP